MCLQGAFSAGYQVFEDAHAATAAGMMSTQIVPVAGGYSGPGYHVAEPADDYKRTHSRNNAPAALQSASDYANVSYNTTFHAPMQSHHAWQ